MPKINYSKIREAYEADPVRTRSNLRVAMQEKAINPTDWSIQESFAELAGYGALRRVRSGELISDILREDAVVSGTFSTIASAALSTRVREAYNETTQVFSPLVPVVPSRLKKETIPGISQIGDKSEEIPEGEDYPMVGVSEDYIEAGPTVKHGMIIALTRESVLFDRTGVLLERARQVGEWIGVQKEKRIIKGLLDTRASSASTEHRYRWRGTEYDTYASSGGHGIVNLKTSNGLTDYTDIQNAELLFSQMTDSDTGEPIQVVPKHLICTPALVATAARILNAIEIEQGSISGTVPVTHSPSPVGQTLGLGLNPYKIVTSALLNSLISTNTDWFLGDIGKLLAYIENWPLTTAIAPPNSHDEFHRDIVQQFKAGERGAVATTDPHYMVLSTA